MIGVLKHVSEAEHASSTDVLEEKGGNRLEYPQGLASL